MNKHSPTPWTVRPHLPDAHFETIADANDATVGTVTLFENAEYIVKADASAFELACLKTDMKKKEAANA